MAGTNSRGKTSYLDRVVSQANEAPALAVMLTLDGGVPALYQIVSLVERLIDDVDDVSVQASGARRLRKEWQRSTDSPFALRGADRLHSDRLLRDLRYIQRVAAEAGRPKLVVCLDEGQRIEPFALSALKASVGQLTDFLLVLSLRLADETDDPVQAGRVVLDRIAAGANRDLGASRLFISGVALGPFSVGGLLSYLMPVIVAVAASVMSAYTMDRPDPASDRASIAFAFIAAVSVMGGSALLVWERLRRLARTGGARPGRLVQRAVDELVMATREVPTSAREELFYRLVREGPESPAEALRRLLTELTGHWRVTAETDRRLHSWIDGFVALDLADRQAVAERIRSTLL